MKKTQLLLTLFLAMILIGISYHSNARITGVNHVCQGFTITLSDSTTGGTAYWSSGDTTVASIGISSGVVTGRRPGSSLITHHGSGATDTFRVYVYANPPAITGTATVCTGATTTLRDSVSGGAWSSSSSSTASVTSDGIVHGISSGTATITYTSSSSSGSCYTTRSVTVSTTPSAGRITGATTVCIGATITLADTTATATGRWRSVTTSRATIGASSGTLTGVSVGTDSVYFADSNSCGVARTGTLITIMTTPSAGSITGSSSVCTGFSITLTDTVSGGTWSVSHPSMATVTSGGVVTGLTSGVDTIKYTVTNSCGSTVARKVVTVNTTPYVGGISGPSTTCIGYSITLTDSTTGGSWSSSSISVATVGAGSSGATVHGVSSGTTTITYTVSGGTTGCTAYATHTVTVGTGATSAGSITGSGTDCIGSVITLADSITGGSWSSSNSSIATVNSYGQVTGVAAGTVTISYTITSYCGTFVATHTVTVSSGSGSAGTISGASSVCTGSTITLTDGISGGAWTSSNSSIATVNSTGVVGGVAAGTVNISYTVTSSCGTFTATHAVTVTATPTTSISGPSTVCAGASISLVDSSASGGVSWSSSNSSVATIDASGNVYGVSAGIDTIYISVYSYCGYIYASHVVTVTGAPSTAGTISGSSSVCTGAAITLTDAVSGGSWTSSNSSIATASSGVIGGVATGSVTITYTVSNSCGSAIATHAISVSSAPSVGSISGPSSVCAGAAITLTDGTSGGAWSSSNSSIATASSSGTVGGVSTGTVTISYSVTGSCGTGVATHTLTVITLPSAGTISGASSICTGAEITLTDGASGGTWRSSDTAVAYAYGAGNIYGISTGTATISYSVTNTCGTTTATYSVTVNTVPAAPASIAGSSTVCTGFTTALTDATSGGTWTSSTTSVATVNSSGLVSGVSSGSTTISSTVSNTCGSTSTLHTLAVNPSAAAGTISGASVVCQGASVTFTDGATGGTWSSSNSSIAGVNTAGVVTGASGGTATITYTVTNSCGTAIATASITVTALPNAGSVSGVSSLCPGTSATFTDGATGGTWSSSNTSVATVNSAGVATGVAAGTTNIMYSVTNSCGTVSASSILTVGSRPSADTITGPSSLCVGGSITLSDAASGGTWVSSNPSIASVSSTGVVTGISLGTIAISYTVTNSCGTAVTASVISVGSLPSAGTITGPSVVCTGTTIDLTDAVTGGGWLSSNNAIATVGATGIVTGVSSGTVTISYYFSSSCATAIATTTITVSSSATAGTITGLGTVCVGSMITLADAVSGGTWSSSNAARATVSASGVVSGVTSGSVTISYSISGGCGSVVATKAVAVNPLVTVAAITGASSLCIGTTTTLADATSGGGWISSNTAVATVSTSGVVTGVTVGSATITYFVTSSCGTSTTTHAVTVNSLSAGILGGSSTVAAGSLITLTSTVSGGVWSSTNTALATVNASGAVTGVSVGIDTIKYAVTNSCGTATARKIVSVTAGREESPVSGAVAGTETGDNIKLYPNPNTGTFTLEIPGTTGTASVLISDMSGRILEMKTSDDKTMYFDIAHFAAGTYLVKVNVNGQTYNQKVMIQ